MFEITLQNAARHNRQISSTKEQSFIVFVNVLQRKVLRLLERLLRLNNNGSSPQRACDNLTKVTPVPIAELSSSFRQSDNGGSYERLGETLIIGPAWTRDLINDAPKLVEPPPFGVMHIDNGIVCGEGIIWKKTSHGLYAVSETLTNARSPESRHSGRAF
ncbi:MAG TPA: hypothetical protein VKA03_05360 [Methylovirgula sp.]|nr:hypothetical protein [Methylovirgula sp.]